MQTVLIKIDCLTIYPTEYYLTIDKDKNRAVLAGIEYSFAYTFDLNVLEQDLENFKKINELNENVKNLLVNEITKHI